MGMPLFAYTLAQFDESGPGLNWKIYTKPVAVEGGVAIRWFWRKPVTEGRTESPHGYTTRAECEEDAMLHGYERPVRPISEGGDPA
jgi:hypothetical protein